MKSLYTRVAATAGLLLSALGAQAAQNFDINFRFRTPAGEHPAGTYTLDVRDGISGATKIIYLRDAETRKAVMFYPVSGIEKMNGDGPARLAFRCNSTGCNLAEVWAGPTFGYAVRQRKPTAAEAERMAVVVPARNTPSE
jgi:hypothetical protein